MGSYVNDIMNIRTPELINQMITMFMPTVDPLFRVVTTSEQVVSNSDSNGLSRDYKVRKLYKGSFAGVVESDPNGAAGSQRTVVGEDVVDLGGRFHGYNSANFATYPNPFEGPNQKTATMTISLIAYRASLLMTLAEMRAETLPAFIGQIYTPTLMGFVRNLVQRRAVDFYADSTTGTIGTIASYALTGSGPYYMTFTMAGISNRLKSGMEVDLLDTSSSDARLNETGAGARLPVYVRSVNPYTDQVVLVTASNPASAFTAAPANGDKLVPRNAKDKTADGLNKWFVNSGSLYGVDTAVFPELRSFIKADSGPLTEMKLRRYLHRFRYANQSVGQTIDTIVTEEGVFAAYLANKAPQFQLQRGSPMNLSGEGDTGELVYTYNGQKLRFTFSDYIQPGYMYGLKMGGGNLKRYVPPRTPMTRDLPGGNIPSFLELEFVLPALANGDVWDTVRMPVSSTGPAIATGAKYTIADSRFQIVPDQFAGIKVTGLESDTLASD